jgi:uncharacterized protein YndB with AHSA1/START domain
MKKVYMTCVHFGQDYNECMEKIIITVDINRPIEYVWNALTQAEWITLWNFASDDWACPKASIHLEVNKRFNYRMEAKDGSFGFDFEGTFTQLTLGKSYAYVMDDGRQVNVVLEVINGNTRVTESFDPETENPIELQREGWLAILNNLKKVCEEKL